MARIKVVIARLRPRAMSFSSALSSPSGTPWGIGRTPPPDTEPVSARDLLAHVADGTCHVASERVPLRPPLQVSKPPGESPAKGNQRAGRPS